MAKVTAPLFGFGASGTIAKALTFATWQGVPYARQRVIPRNPRTTAQVATRTAFSIVNLIFRALPGSIRNIWTDSSQGRPLTARNAFMSNNLPNIRGAADTSAIMLSPGTRSAPAIGPITAVAGSGAGEIDITYSAPVLPTGWTLVNVHFVAFPDDLPADVAEWTFIADTEDTPAGPHTLAGLTAAADYVVTVYAELTRPDGATAYSISRNDTATAGA